LPCYFLLRAGNAPGRYYCKNSSSKIYLATLSKKSFPETEQRLICQTNVISTINMRLRFVFVFPAQIIPLIVPNIILSEIKCFRNWTTFSLESKTFEIRKFTEKKNFKWQTFWTYIFYYQAHDPYPGFLFWERIT